MSWKVFKLVPALIGTFFCTQISFGAEAAPPILHSHNDYHQKRPLDDALAHHFDSVEADIWVHNNDLMISHLGFFYGGSLKALYLDPLQAKIKEHGSVYGDGKPFYLWIDI